MVDKAVICKKCGAKGLVSRPAGVCGCCGGEEILLPYTVEEYCKLSKEEKEGLYEKYDIHPLIPTYDALDISLVTNKNYAVVDAMIELRQKDIIEYELKMSQFRDRAKQIRLARIAEEERVKCPRCGSTNITTGQRGFKLTTGFIGSNKTVNRCGNCGYSWKP